MRLVFDTNVLLSALLVRGTAPDRLYQAWRSRKFDLVSGEHQLEEFRRVMERSYFREHISRSKAGRVMNEIRARSIRFDRLPEVRKSSDPDDDWFLALCEASLADYLVTGDKSGLLALERHGRTRIVTPAEMVKVLG